MEDVLRIVKRYKCHYCCVCKNYRGKVLEDGRKVSLHRILAEEIVSAWKHGEKRAFFGSLEHQQQVLGCCQTRADYRPSNMPLKLAL